jgi:hypothetical protein
MGYYAPLDMDVWGQTSLPEINRGARASVFCGGYDEKGPMGYCVPLDMDVWGQTSIPIFGKIPRDHQG